MTKGAKLLRAARVGRGLTQYQAGLLVGLPSTQISNYETAAREPGRTAAVAIERAFGVPVAAWDEAVEGERAAG